MRFGEGVVGRRGAFGVLAAGSVAAVVRAAPTAPATAPDARSAIRSFADFGALPDGAMPPPALYAALERAWRSALENGHDLYHPGGIYDIGNRNFPWRQPAGATSLLDCRDITIVGNGPGSIFRTTSADGADVFQLNALSNLHFRNLAVTAILTGKSGSGSNGISITGGYDNITLLDIWCHDLPSVDTGKEVDGGKALTIQCDAASLEVGVLTARIFASNCSQGLGIDVGLVRFADKKFAVKAEIVAEGCYTAIAIGGATATAEIPEDVHWGISVAAQAVNCQKDVWLARAYGVDIECQVITTQSSARRRCDADGIPWFATDRLVEALVCAFAKNARVNMYGDKGECDHKARIGGAVAGHGGRGTSANCDLRLDIAGLARSAAIEAIDSGGNSLTNSRLTVSASTGTLPDEFFVPQRNNLIIYGSHVTAPGASLSGPLTLVGADGVTAIAKLIIRDDGLCVQQLSASAPDSPILTFLNHKGSPVATLRNDGLLAGSAMIPGRAATGRIVGSRPEYDRNGALLGYIPIYRDITSG